MSLLDTGRETVTVYPQVMVTDSDGTDLQVPSTVGVTGLASVQPQSIRANPVGEAAVIGQQLTTTYRLRLARGFPISLGPWAKVEWRGRDWDVVGEPQRSNGSDTTAHIVALIRARGA